MKNMVIAASFAAILFIAGACFAYDTDMLVQARELVQQKKYQQALQLYERMAEQLINNPDLLIEWARVYTYADDHQKAIGLFEQVRKNFTDKEKDIIRELAEQYKWDGILAKSIEVYQRALVLGVRGVDIDLGLAQAFAWAGKHKQALDLYDQILRSRPDEVSAILSKAEVLSWDDKLEAADKLYRAVLKREPQNLSARIGLARMKVWQGYYRAGIRLYQEILTQYSDDPDALEGIAFAYHWDGQEAKALNVLERLLSKYPQRHYARELYQQICGVSGVHLEEFNKYSYDSNKLYVRRDGIHGGSWINDSTNAGMVYSTILLRQDGKLPVHGSSAGIDLSQRWTEVIETNSRVYLNQYLHTDGFNPWTNNSWLTLRLNDFTRFDLSYDRETFEDISALRNKIITNSGGVSCDIRPDRYWFISGKYKYSDYSDDNRQDAFFSKLEYRLTNKPYSKLYYNFYSSTWNKQFDHGYFNPSRISSHVLGIYASKDLSKRLFAQAQVSTGYERQRPKSDHPTYFGGLEFDYRLNPQWSVSVRGEYFNALDTNPKKTYSKKSCWMFLTYSFGAGGQSAQTYSATQPARSNVQ